MMKRASVLLSWKQKNQKFRKGMMTAPFLSVFFDLSPVLLWLLQLFFMRMISHVLSKEKSLMVMVFSFVLETKNQTSIKALANQSKSSLPH